MKLPEVDICDRLDVWEAMEIFWLDTDANIRFSKTARICAESKYSIENLEAIFWNEAFPAFKFNLLDIAGEWGGFPRDWITKRVLNKNSFGSPVNTFRGIMRERGWWKKLEREIIRLRMENK